MGRFIGGIGLALVAIMIAIAGMVSIYTPVLSTFSLGKRHALALSFYDGRVRLFYFQSEVEAVQAGPRYVRFPAGETPRIPILGAPILPRIRVERLPLPIVVPSDRGAGHAWYRQRIPYDVNLGDRRTVADFGGAWRAPMARGFSPRAAMEPAGEMSYFRLPVWLPVALLILFPVRSMIVGPWRERRRRKKNQCIGCGYNLYGLTEPRCPECGSACKIGTTGEGAIPQ